MADHPYPRVLQPGEYERGLLPHQLTSIYEMERFEREKKTYELGGVYLVETSLAIQADPTGYGKTCSLVGLIVRDCMEWPAEGCFTRDEMHACCRGLSIRRRTQHERVNTTLVVCSQSIIGQWSAELALTTLRTVVVKTRKGAETTEARDNDVVLCTPTMYNYLAKRMKSIAWKRFVYDEPDSCHIPAMRPITAGFTWLVTATPESLRFKYSGRTGHYLASFSLGSLENTFFRALLVRNEISYVEASWSMPAVHHTTYQCSQPIARVVSGLVPEFVEMMVAAGNVRGAVSSLGGGESDNIMEVIRTRFEEDLLEATQKIERYRARRNEARHAEWERKRERIVSRLKELTIRCEGISDAACPVCIGQVREPVMVSCCHNVFCGECILRWVEKDRSCPICRRPVSPSSLTYISLTEASKTRGAPPAVERTPSKPELVVKIIRERPESQVIIFSEEDATYSLVEVLLRDEGIECREIKGRTETRERIIRRFKAGDLKVMFLNPKNNGAGIDLQECTDIILYHKMYPDVQTQILGRANRIGRVQELHVHHLHIQR